MGLVIPFDPAGLDPKIVNALDELIVAIQTWAGKQDGAGKWVDVPYDSSFYRATAGTWTVQQGDQRVFRYTVLQDVMILRIALIGTATDANVTNDLRVLIPGNYRATDQQYLGAFSWNAEAAALSATGMAFAMASPNDRYVRLLRDTLATSTNWPASETGLNIQGTFLIPVAPVS